MQASRAYFDDNNYHPWTNQWVYGVKTPECHELSRDSKQSTNSRNPNFTKTFPIKLIMLLLLEFLSEIYCSTRKNSFLECMFLLFILTCINTLSSLFDWGQVCHCREISCFFIIFFHAAIHSKRKVTKCWNKGVAIMIFL